MVRRRRMGGGATHRRAASRSARRNLGRPPRVDPASVAFRSGASPAPSKRFVNHDAGLMASPRLANADSLVKERTMGDVSIQLTGSLLPFPASSDRPARRALGPEEPRGEILLFTGVRYERQIEPSPEPISPRRGSVKRRRG